MSSAIIQTVNVGASVASTRPPCENRRRSTRNSMSSTASPGRPSAPTLTSKKSSSTTSTSTSTTNIHAKRATSSENLAYSGIPSLKKESSSGFNYQQLTDTSPLNVPKTKQKIKPPVRSHSSSNAELSYHLQQLKNFGKRKATFSSEERTGNDERIRLTSSNLKVECDETGTSTTVALEATETSIELPISWKPAIQQVTIQRDSWDHKVEFLLAVIGYAVDLGTYNNKKMIEKVGLQFFRCCFD